VCVAVSVINGQERRDQSDPVDLRVIGPPQILRAGAGSVSAVQGQPALLELVFCADPLPSRAVWLWDGRQLQAGNGQGRYTADDLTQDSREDCYQARLRIEEVTELDQLDYTLHVVNEHGTDRHTVALSVKGAQLAPKKASISKLIIIAVGCGAVLLLAIVLGLIVTAYRSRSCCFSDKGGFKSSEIDSEKAGNGDSRNGGSLGAIPPDALYVTAKKPPPGVGLGVEVSAPTRV